MNEPSLGQMYITASTVSAVPFFRRELDGIGVGTNPTKTIALPPKAHFLKVEETTLLASFDVRISNEGRATTVGVPIGIDAYEAKLARGRGSEGRRGDPRNLSRACPTS